MSHLLASRVLTQPSLAFLAIKITLLTAFAHSLTAVAIEAVVASCVASSSQGLCLPGHVRDDGCELPAARRGAGVRRLDLNLPSPEEDVTTCDSGGKRRATRGTSGEGLDRDARPGAVVDEDSLAYTNWQLDIAERLIRQQQLEIRRLKDRFVPSNLRPRTDIVCHSDVILSEESMNQDLFRVENNTAFSPIAHSWTFSRGDVSNNNLFVEPRMQRLHDDMEDIVLSISDTDLSTLSLH